MFKCASDIGLVRNENQDRVGVWEKDHITLALLCDGMGGHFGGSEASSLVILAFEKAFNDLYDVSWDDQAKIQNWFYESVKKAKSLMNIKARQNELFNDMGTTVTAAIINHKTHYIYVMNIGDSRTYILGHSLKQITIDHNLQNYYIREFNYSYRKASKLKNAKGLVSALGPTKRTQLEIFVIEPSQQVRMVIVTSDGIHDHISEPVFEQILSAKNKSLDEKALQIIDLAKRNNSLDNLTIGIVEI